MPKGVCNGFQSVTAGCELIPVSMKVGQAQVIGNVLVVVVRFGDEQVGAGGCVGHSAGPGGVAGIRNHLPRHVQAQQQGRGAAGLVRRPSLGRRLVPARCRRDPHHHRRGGPALTHSLTRLCVNGSNRDHGRPATGDPHPRADPGHAPEPAAYRNHPSRFSPSNGRPYGEAAPARALLSGQPSRHSEALRCYLCEDFQTDPSQLHVHEGTLRRILEFKALAEQSGDPRAAAKNERIAEAIRHLIDRVETSWPELATTSEDSCGHAG